MSLSLPPIARIGDPLNAVCTPALLLDLDAYESNLSRMAELAARHRVALRPHAKAHKSVAIAQAQLAAGAVGICCQKLSEAYPFAAAGIRNILISNEFVGADKVSMAVELAREVDLSVCVDHHAQVQAIGEAAAQAGVTITVLIEVEAGQNRCGVADAGALHGLVDAVAACPALRFGGLQGYHGGAQHVADWMQRREAAGWAADATSRYVRYLEGHGIRCGVVTGGGTGTAEFDAASGVYTEIQPGSYAFMDRHYGSLEWSGAVKPQHALFIATTVMSTTRPSRIVCDAGLKSLSAESGMPALARMVEGESLQYVAANDEHGIIEVLQGDMRDRLGEKMLLVPGHCDPTVNLHDQLVCFRGDRVEALWPIEARGLSR